MNKLSLEVRTHCIGFAAKAGRPTKPSAMTSIGSSFSAIEQALGYISYSSASLTLISSGSQKPRRSEFGAFAYSYLIQTIQYDWQGIIYCFASIIAGVNYLPKP